MSSISSAPSSPSPFSRSKGILGNKNWQQKPKTTAATPTAKRANTPPTSSLISSLFPSAANKRRMTAGAPPAPVSIANISPQKPNKGAKENKDSKAAAASNQIEDEPFMEEIKKKSRLLDAELANFKAENEVCG